MTKKVKYNPNVRVKALKSLPKGWTPTELEPVIFRLAHPVVLEAEDGKSYLQPEGTMIMVVGALEPKHD